MNKKTADLTKIIVRRIPEGSICPWWMGAAWFDLCRGEVVVVAMPFNWLVGWTRRAYYRVMQGPAPAAYDKGYYDCRADYLFCPQRRFSGYDRPS